MGALIFDYEGHELHYDPDTEMGSLTAMWDAAGRPANKEPWDWARDKPAREFIAALCEKLNLPEKQVLDTRQGRNGGTWAHRQIGMEYARYLSPQLAIRWNQIVEDVLYNGRSVVAINPASDVRALVSLGDELATTINTLTRTHDALKQFGIGIIETDQQLTLIQPRVAELSRVVQKQIQAQKKGYFYVLLPNGERDGDQVYIKTGTEKTEGGRESTHQVTNVTAKVWIRVEAIDSVNCETIINNALPRFARQKGTKDHFPRLPREVAEHLVRWLKELEGPLTVDKAREYRPPSGWWS